MAHLTESLYDKDTDFDEIEEDFHAVMGNIKPETKVAVEFETVYIVSPMLPGNSEIPGSQQSLQTSETAIDKALCRLCATRSNNLIDMFGRTELHKHIIEQIQYCLPIEVKKNDGLPERACRSCLEKLDLCYKFHKSVTQAEKQLFSSRNGTSLALDQVKRYFETAPQCTGEFVAVEIRDHEDLELDTASDQETDDIELIELDNLDQDNRTRNLEAELESDENVDRHKSQRRSATKGNKRNKALQSKCLQKCKGCKKKFNSNESLEVHKDICTKLPLVKKSYSCSHCGEVFAQKGNIGRHMRTHTGERPFACDICSKTFISKEGRDIHRRRHTGDRPFKCSICESFFISSQAVSQHAKVHSKDKPYHCFRCDKSYKHRYSRDKHLLAKHKR